MAGTREGGLKAAATLKARRGSDFYVRIGRKGGKVEVPKGFSKNKRVASLAGSKGARIRRARLTKPERTPVPKIRRIHVMFA